MSLSRRSVLSGAVCAASLPPAAGRAAPTLAQSSPANGDFDWYSLVSGRRDRLSDLFEREFIAPRIAQGALAWTSADQDHPDRFVWLRGVFDPPAASGPSPPWRPSASLRFLDIAAALRCERVLASCEVRANGELSTRVLTRDELAFLALDPGDMRTRPKPSPGVSRDA